MSHVLATSTTNEAQIATGATEPATCKRKLCLAASSNQTSLEGALTPQRDASTGGLLRRLAAWAKEVVAVEWGEPRLRTAVWRDILGELTVDLVFAVGDGLGLTRGGRIGMTVAVRPPGVRRAALRRTATTDEVALIDAEDFRVDLAAKQAFGSDGDPIRLTPTEWHVLEVLV
jgi:hypothetical protein